MGCRSQGGGEREREVYGRGFMSFFCSLGGFIRSQIIKRRRGSLFWKALRERERERERKREKFVDNQIDD